MGTCSETEELLNEIDPADYNIANGSEEPGSPEAPMRCDDKEADTSAYSEDASNSAVTSETLQEESESNDILSNKVS